MGRLNQPESGITTTTEDASAPMPAGSEALAPDAVSPPKRNWIIRHWRGEESLGIAYWRNSVLLANITPALLLTLFPLLDPVTLSLRWDSTVSLVLVPLLLLVWLWGIVGAMR